MNSAESDWVSQAFLRLEAENKLRRRPTPQEWDAIWRAANSWAESTGAATAGISIENFIRDQAPGLLVDDPRGAPPVPAVAAAPAPAPERTATRTKKTEFAGWGAAVQGLGVLLCIVLFPIGILPGIVLLIVGGRMATVYRCSECGEKVRKEGRRCPHCDSVFKA